MNGSTVSKAGESSEWLSCGFKHILPEGGLGWKEGLCGPCADPEDSRQEPGSRKTCIPSRNTSTRSILLCSHCTLKQMISLFFGGRGGESNK